MVKVVALQSHTYDQKPRCVGEIYEAHERDVRFLKAFGNAEIAPVSETKPESKPAEPDTRRRYKRRDMRSE
jgi:hypothetical protein